MSHRALSHLAGLGVLVALGYSASAWPQARKATHSAVVVTARTDDSKDATKAPFLVKDLPLKLRVLDEKDDPARAPDVIFVPTPQEVVEKMLEVAGVKKTDVLFSLGCGDGRYMVTAAKKYGCLAVGFEIDPQRVKDSTLNIAKNRLEKLAFVRQRDIFKLDLSEATVVTMYLLPSLNVKLVPQLKKLKPGARIVSHAFDMRGYKPDKVVRVTTKTGRVHEIYLWTAPLKPE